MGLGKQSTKSAGGLKNPVDLLVHLESLNTLGYISVQGLARRGSAATPLSLGEALPRSPLSSPSTSWERPHFQEVEVCDCAVSECE